MKTPVASRYGRRSRLTGRWSRTPDELLHVPVKRVRDVDVLFPVERQVVRLAVAVGALALRAARAEHFAIQIELHDEAGVAVRHHDVLLVVAHAKPAGRARMARFAEECPLAVENLYALIGSVGDVYVAL